MMSFDSVATLGPTSPPPSPSSNRRRKTCARKCERYCCAVASYFPLAFVYGLTSWAVWVQASIGFLPAEGVWTGLSSACVGLLFYLLLNWSYTTAVFTDPGSPLKTTHPYSTLPTREPSTHTSFTVKSTGDLRFCKKCQAKKPDRAHHCSSCRRCVLKMDHHCPWLAACVGLHNYKSFLLFLIYTCFFCWFCFTVSATWVWREVLNDSHFQERLMPVNYILLAAMAGTIGLVLTGFTLWHIYLACKGQTTIESLETTRYLTPLRNSIKQQLQQRNPVGPDGLGIGDQLREIHANILPGVTRPEEGEERSSPAQGSLRRNYNDLEEARERERYDDYLDEQDSEKLPNAFDLGWRRNLRHVFGEKLLYWALPICNTTGDGWQWEASPRWLEASRHLAKEREARVRENEAFDRERRGWQSGPVVDFRGSPSRHTKDPHVFQPSSQMSSQHFDKKMNGTFDREDTSSDEEGQADSERRPLARPQSTAANWNDLPEDFLGAPRAGQVGNRARSRSHSTHRKTDKETRVPT